MTFLNKDQWVIKQPTPAGHGVLLLSMPITMEIQTYSLQTDTKAVSQLKTMKDNFGVMTFTMPTLIPIQQWKCIFKVSPVDYMERAIPTGVMKKIVYY